MPFLFEKSSTRQWSCLQAEHDLLEAHLAFKGYLDHRVADNDRKIVVYYVKGIGMGDGRRFAMVYAGHIIWFDILKVRGVYDTMSTPLRIDSAELPQVLNNQRNTITNLLAEALEIYEQNTEYEYCATHLSLDSSNTRWRVIPSKYSWLYWKTKSAWMWSKHKSQLHRVVDCATCPLVSASIFALLAFLPMAGIPVPIWSFFLVGAWLFHRMDRYDDDFSRLYWLVGITKMKSKHPLAFQARWALIDQRLMHPVPLKALSVRVRLERGNAKFCTLQLTNHSWFFVSYVSIGSVAIADTIAPGFTESLRAENKGAIDGKKLQAVFPNPVRKWLLPRQSVQWTISLLDAYPMRTPPTHIQAFVNISKRASGEKNHSATSFLLPVSFAGIATH